MTAAIYARKSTAHDGVADDAKSGKLSALHQRGPVQHDRGGRGHDLWRVHQESLPVRRDIVLMPPARNDAGGRGPGSTPGEAL